MKNTPEQVVALRNDFNNTVRKTFLKTVATEQHDALLKADFSESDIAKMASGYVPKGYQVHHIMPLDDSGTNLFDNLILIDSANHSVLTAYQNSFCKNLVPGESVVITWPFFKGNFYTAFGG